MSKVRSVRAIIVAALLILAIAAVAAGGTILRLRAIVIEEGVKDTANTAIVIAELQPGGRSRRGSQREEPS